MRSNRLLRAWTKVGVLLLIALAIKIVSFFNVWIEEKYSTGLYRAISLALRTIFGWLPFSMGDVIYTWIFIWLLIELIKAIKALFQKKVSKESFLLGLAKLMKFVLWTYILFNILWGLNYDRMGIAYQLKLQPKEYSTQELKTLTDSLIVKVNASRRALKDSTLSYQPIDHIFDQVADAYNNAEKQYPFLRYRQRSVKRTLYGRLCNYLGIMGYYDPFSGEAQVNTTVPGFFIPYTTCHEMAHQLGYATEDEANFAGYLAAKNSNDTLFHYSVYFDLLQYANGELYMRDSAAAKQNYRSLDTLVKGDIKIYRKFLKENANPLEPVFRRFYGQYLKANNQPQGIDTYTEVVAWLIAYQKKYGEL